MKNEQRILKPTNLPTSILMHLLQWLTNLELSGGNEGEQNPGTLLTEPLWLDSMEKGKRNYNQPKKTNDMKTMNRMMKGLALLLLVFAGTMGAMAQTSTTPTQSVCPGTEPYKIIPDNPANTFLWSITPGTSGVDWTISSPTTVSTDIVWSNPATPQTYTVTFKEMAATGCFDEVNVVVTVNPLPVLKITDPSAVCSPGTIDLTAAAITAGSTLPTGTVLSYWTDATAATTLATPSTVGISGTYYIKAVTVEGCSAIAAVNVTINPQPVLVVTDPSAVCSPGTVDLTNAAITAESTLPAGTLLSYWTDAAATIALATPNAVATSGTYYIKAETGVSCSAIAAVNVTINPQPVLVITDPLAVCSPGTVDLTAAAITAGSTLPTGTVLSYWTDATAATTLATPSTVGISGTYYIKAVTVEGCSAIAAVNVTINPQPVLVVTDPSAVCSPGTVDLTNAAITAESTLPAGTLLSYWTDAAATIALATPNAVATSGTYYIKAQSAVGCSAIAAVHVTINTAPVPTLAGPTPICEATTSNVYSTEPGMSIYAWVVSAGGTITAGGTATDNTVTVTWNTAGPQTVSVNYQNASGCSAATPTIYNVTVNPLPKTSPIYHN